MSIKCVECNRGPCRDGEIGVMCLNSKTFGSRDCELEQENLSRIAEAEALGWKVWFVYDDMYGGLYLAGIDPNGRWRKYEQ